MQSDLERAKALLKAGDHTLVLVKGEDVLTFNERGVKPLYRFVGIRTFDGYSAADKVVGKGAAFLHAYLHIAHLSTEVLSVPAKEVLDRYGVPYEATSIVDRIENHDHTGYCPIETAVESAESIEEALPLIQAKLQAMGLV